jgi:D-serine dehydratase
VRLGSTGTARAHKGIPLPDGVALGRLGELGWDALTSLETPVMLLHREALEHNIATMARYVGEAGVLLAPHTKTSLSRQVVEAQLAAGAWGLTAATVGQVRALHGWGVRRIVLANVVVDPRALAWICATLLTAHDETELWCYVDSLQAVTVLEGLLGELDPPRPLGVLLEVGYAGGRTGVRSRAEAVTVAEAVHASSRLVLGGVAGFEGLMSHRPAAPSSGLSSSSSPSPSPSAVPAEVTAFVDEIGATARELGQRGLFDDDAPLVTAGGSAYFDVVCARLGPSVLPAPFRTVLRSGCYVTHDHGMYQRTSPLDGRASTPATSRLRPALELVAHVLSTPEPGLAIVGFGRRDVPVDDRLPVLLGRHRDGRLTPLPPVVVHHVNDQHAHLRMTREVEQEAGLSPGDLLSFGISHPCGAFDRWAAMPVVDSAYAVVGVLTTDM